MGSRKMSDKIHISLLLGVATYILIFTLLYQNTEKINKFTLVNVSTGAGIEHEILLKTTEQKEHTTALQKNRYDSNDPEIQWIKYGEEKTDWALLINSRMCVEASDVEKKKLVIYSTKKSNSTEIPGKFKVTFIKGNPPEMYSIEKNRTAYFITIRGDERTIEYCNLHHFMGDFAATFHAIQNLIHYGEKQSVFFQLPTRSLHHFLLPLYEAIGIRYTDQYLFHDYNQVPAGTCFGQSIIADADHSPWRRRGSERRHHHYNTEMLPVIQRIKSYFNISSSECRNESYPKITLLNRDSSRKILNANLLLEALVERGYKNTQITLLELMTMEDQLKLIHCTDVLVGVQGAGLQWASFLQENAAIVEIAWPTRGWHFFYSGSDFALEFFPDIRLFQVEVPAEDVIFPEHYSDKNGVLGFLDAREGQATVPVESFGNTVSQAVSGAPSNNPWKRFEVGDFEQRRSRLPK